MLQKINLLYFEALFTEILVLCCKLTLYLNHTFHLYFGKRKKNIIKVDIKKVVTRLFSFECMDKSEKAIHVPCIDYEKISKMKSIVLHSCV